MSVYYFLRARREVTIRETRRVGRDSNKSGEVISRLETYRGKRSRRNVQVVHLGDSGGGLNFHLLPALSPALFNSRPPSRESGRDESCSPLIISQLSFLPSLQTCFCLSPTLRYTRINFFPLFENLSRREFSFDGGSRKGSRNSSVFE